MRVKVEAIRPRNFKSEIKKLAKKYGKVAIIFGGGDSFRKRIIEKDGKCTVAYNYGRGHRWSRFETSCFFDDYQEDQYEWTGGGYDRHGNFREGTRRLKKKGKKVTLNNTIAALIKHDKDCDLMPLQILYGRKLQRKLLVLSDL
jgi:hypothetical protein